CMQGIQFPPTF
nr:immunoglobulin light chain junction region [Macaca mulatta]MPN89161.1 immunoglobulin light chain junction region [Macaca mulatta]